MDIVSTYDLDAELHATDIDALEQRMVELALQLTGARNGGVFVWDEAREALVINSHVVEGLTVNLPNVMVQPRTDGRPNGIALWVWENNASYLCADASLDPHYARYFVDVLSIAAVPISYQHRAIGVLTVSMPERNALDTGDVERLEALAAVCAKHLRRALLYREGRGDEKRPFLIKGMSPEWLEVERRIEAVSPTDAAVLVHGESGTGKDLVANAQGKLKAKKLDLIVANDITAEDAGFEVDTNRVTLIAKGGEPQELELMSKEEVARQVVARVIGLLG